MLGMSDALQGLYACRADLERRISTFQNFVPEPDVPEPDSEAGTAEPSEGLHDLRRRLQSVINQIDVYTGHGIRWTHSA